MAFRLVLHLAAVHYAVVVSRREQTSVGKQCDVCVGLSPRRWVQRNCSHKCSRISFIEGKYPRSPCPTYVRPNGAWGTLSILHYNYSRRAREAGGFNLILC